MKIHNEPDDETRSTSPRILPNSLLPAWPSSHLTDRMYEFVKQFLSVKCVHQWRVALCGWVF
jgi:hypothetical protein